MGLEGKRSPRRAGIGYQEHGPWRREPGLMSAPVWSSRFSPKEQEGDEEKERELPVMLEPLVVRTDPYRPFASSFQLYRSVILCFGPSVESAVGDRTSRKFPAPCFSVADSLVLSVLWFLSSF